MSYYGCHNSSDVFIVNLMSGESYFCDLHCRQVPTPYSKIHYTSQQTYNKLMANGWKSLTHCQVNDLTKTMFECKKTSHFSHTIPKSLFIISFVSLIRLFKNKVSSS